MRRLKQSLAAALGLLLLAAAAPAGAEDSAAPLPPLVVFDTVWKDFHLAPKPTAEVEQHVAEFVKKAGGFRVLERGERDRTILDRRIFVMGQPDLPKAEEIARQAGWRHILHATFKGVPGKGVLVTFVVRDLSVPGEAGVFLREKVLPNHLKALRNGARQLAFEAVKAARAALAAPAPAPTAP